MASHHADPGEITFGVVGEFAEKRLVDRENCLTGYQQGVAVGGRGGDMRGSDIAARAGPVLNDPLMPGLGGQRIGERARHHVCRATGSEGDDHSDGPGRKAGLGSNGPGECSH